MGHRPPGIDKIDSFDHYNTSQIPFKYGSTSNIYLTGGGIIQSGGRFGGNHWNGTGGNYLIHSFSTNRTGIGVSFAIKYGDSTSLAVNPIVVVGQINLQPYYGTFELGVDVNHTLVFRKENQSPTVTSSGIVLPVGAWCDIQLGVTIGSVGNDYTISVTLSLNGGPPYIATINLGYALQYSSLNPPRIAVGGYANLIDDLIIMTTPVPIADSHIRALYPLSDGTHLEWTPNSGAVHFDRVNQTVPDADATYVESSVEGQRDLYSFEQLTNSGSIACVQPVVCIKQDGVLPQACTHLIRQSGVDYQGSESFPVGLNYAFGLDPRATDPSTGVAWTYAKVNSAKYGKISAA